MNNMYMNMNMCMSMDMNMCMYMLHVISTLIAASAHATTVSLKVSFTLKAQQDMDSVHLQVGPGRGLRRATVVRRAGGRTPTPPALMSIAGPAQ